MLKLHVNKILHLQDNIVKLTINSFVPEINKIFDIWYFIETNHRCNQLLWHEEDLARRNHVDDAEIVKNKRAIDGFNQKRNDAIENIDQFFLKEIDLVKKPVNARLNSETAGSMIDRLSILCLKIQATYLQTLRLDVDKNHIDTCNLRISILKEQRSDLAFCLENLLRECQSGKAYFKTYKQYKMYNDPKFNSNIK